MTTVSRHLGALLLLAGLPLVGVPAAADPLPELAPTVVEYDIQVRLDTEAKRLLGAQRVVWHNPSEDTVDDLEAQSRGVLDLLGLPWDPAVLSFHRRARATFSNTPSYAAVSEPGTRWRSTALPGPSAI